MLKNKPKVVFYCTTQLHLFNLDNNYSTYQNVFKILKKLIYINFKIINSKHSHIAYA